MSDFDTLNPPMPERVGDPEAIRRFRRVKWKIPTKKEKRRLAKREKQLAMIALREVGTAVYRFRQLRATELRAARRLKRPAPPVAPPPAAKREPLEVDRVPIGALPIASLAEGAIALLALPTREVRGLFRWHESRGKRRKRVYYELDGRREIAIPYCDNPKHFFPARPLIAEKIDPPRPPAIDREAADIEPEIDDLAEADSGELSQAQVAAMVFRSLKTLQALPDLEARFLTAGKRINWPTTVDSYEDLQAQKENRDNADSALRPARKRPSSADFSAMDEPLDWFSALNLPPAQRAALIRAGDRPFSPDQWLVWWRAQGMFFKSIAKQLGVTHAIVRDQTDAVFRRLTAIANQRRAEAGRPVAAAVAARNDAERPREISASR